MSRILPFATLFSSSILLFACSSSGSGTGDGSSGQMVNCPQGTHQVGDQCVQDGPSTLSQTTVDDDTAIAITNGADDIYNQNLAGKSTGNQSVTVNCPVGGTVHITGTVGFDSTHNITTVNLVYAMTGCKVSVVSPMGDVNVTVSLNGTMTETGSWDGSTYQSVNYQGTGVTMSGTDQRTGYAQATIAQTCDVGLTVNQSGSTVTTSGTVCGRPATN